MMEGRFSGRGYAIRILDLNTFLVLARNRHFARAARELNTTQPAISTRLAALEEEFGCRLVRRGNREFRLTPEGEKALQVFQDVLESLHRLRGELQLGCSSLTTTLRIGAIDSVASTWMPQLIEALYEEAPNLRVEITVEATKDLVQHMVKGELDMIFCLDPAIGDGFRSFIACVWQMIWAGSPKLVRHGHLYSVDELARMPIITFPKDTPPYRQIAPYFQNEQVLASKLISSNSLFAIINFIVDGFGVAALPTVTIERELRAGLLSRIEVEKWFSPMLIVASYQSSTHQNVIQLAVNQVRRVASAFVHSRPGVAWTVETMPEQ